jgi:hypothetical protein
VNLLDFENEFVLGLEFIGDNEVDAHSLSIKREAFDAYGKDIQITERYTVTTETLEQIALGLEAMRIRIRQHLTY